MLLLAVHLPLGKMFSPTSDMWVCALTHCFQLSRHNILVLLTSIYFLIFVILSLLPKKKKKITCTHHVKCLNNKLRRKYIYNKIR